MTLFIANKNFSLNIQRKRIKGVQKFSLGGVYNSEDCLGTHVLPGIGDTAEKQLSALERMRCVKPITHIKDLVAAKLLHKVG